MPASKIQIINAAKKTIPAGKTCEFPMKIQGLSPKPAYFNRLLNKPILVDVK